MKQKLLLIAVLLLAFCGLTFAQVAYTEPAGGWTYIYNGDELQKTPEPPAFLDGTWNENGEWDLLSIGEALSAPGGIEIYDIDGITFLRIQDTGDPRDIASSGITGDPSNRKAAFVHDLTQDGIDVSKLILDAGVTLAFRMKVPVDDGSADLDMLYPNGGDSELPYPLEGDGSETGEGMGMVTLVQNASGSGDGAIGFSYLTTADHDTTLTLGEGLYMNQSAGTALIARPDLLRDAEPIADNGTHNMVECNPREWNEFWVTIEADGVIGTHTVRVWLNGDVASPEEFNVTASDKDHTAAPYLWVGFVNTNDNGAMDLDYVAVKDGLVAPVASGGGTGTFDMSFAGTQLKNYPNPSNGETTFSFNLKRDGYTTLEVYNLTGQTVAKVLARDMPSGSHNISLNVDLLPGQYVYRLQSGDQNEISKMTILE